MDGWDELGCGGEEEDSQVPDSGKWCKLVHLVRWSRVLGVGSFSWDILLVAYLGMQMDGQILESGALGRAWIKA